MTIKFLLASCHASSYNLERITHLQPKGNQICMTIMESISVLLNLNFHPDSLLKPCLQLAATSIMECHCSSVVPFSYSLFSEIRFSLSGSIGQVLVAFFLRTEKSHSCLPLSSCNVKFCRLVSSLLQPYVWHC